jgi:hypothetical protein
MIKKINDGMIHDKKRVGREKEERGQIYECRMYD